MKAWSLQNAKNGLSEVVRRALDHEPQLLSGDGRGDEAVVVVARDDYERLVAPLCLADMLRASPLAEAIAAGELDREDAALFGRARDFGTH